MPGTRRRSLALVAVDSRWRDLNGTFYSFSYGVHALRASVVSAPDLADVDVDIIDMDTPDPDAFFERVIAMRPTVVGMSTYIWSLEVWGGLVERLKRHDPSIVVIAGGPAARRSVLDLPPYQGLRDQLDAVVPGEGEETIRQVLRHHGEPDWQQHVPGLHVGSGGAWRSTGPAERPDIAAYPSPYQLGLAPRGKTGYIETFRGCPIHCAFCQWGEQKSDRAHGAEYLARHLEGIRDAGVANVFFLDAAFNLNPRAFRALVAAEREVNVLRDMVVHGHLYPTHLEQFHLDFFETLARVQASVGVQSFDEDVLSRMGRPFDVRKFERVIERMRGHLDVDMELIFGLPGDSPATFWRTFEKAIGIARSVKVFKCLVLPDALLERRVAMKIDFDPITFGINSCDGWSAADLDREWQRVVRRVEEFGRRIINPDWVGFVCDSEDASLDGWSPGAWRRAIDPSSVRTMSKDVLAAASGWGLDGARQDDVGLYFDLRGPSGEVVLCVRREATEARTFHAKDGLVYFYRGTVDKASAVELRRVIDVIHPKAMDLLLLEVR